MRKGYTVWRRMGEMFAWFGVLDCDSEAEARKWMARMVAAGGYRVTPSGERPGPKDEPEFVKAGPKEVKVGKMNSLDFASAGGLRMYRMPHNGA